VGSSAALRTIAILGCVVATTPALVDAQTKKILPVDEAASDPVFFAFRARLLLALQQRDVQFLYGIVAPDIRNSFGGDDGFDEFKANWKPEDPNSKLWQTLTEVLVLGGQFMAPTRPHEGSKMFVAPYVFTVETGADPFENWVVVGDAVRVRERPDVASPVLVLCRSTSCASPTRGRRRRVGTRGHPSSLPTAGRAGSRRSTSAVRSTIAPPSRAAMADGSSSCCSRAIEASA
jgi:hypothetical protein